MNARVGTLDDSQRARETGATMARSPLVGRDRERKQLDDCVRRAGAGRGSFVLLAGEPGIGKSTLASAAADDAADAGLRVLWGRCWEGGGAPPYWPWIQVLRGLRSAIGSDRDLPAMAQLLPELATGVAAEPSAMAAQERFLLFDGITRYLAAAAQDKPLCVVLEDVHCADALRPTARSKHTWTRRPRRCSRGRHGTPSASSCSR
jgi:predicted ATPase